MEGTTKSRRRRLSGDEWRRVLQRFAVGGEALSAFCRREGLSVSSFRLWRSKLTTKVDEMSAVPATSGRRELRLDLGGGVTLHIVRG